MKPVKTCRSLQLRLAWKCTLVVLLFTASVWAEDPTTSRSSVAAGVSGSDLASKWVGVYDGIGRACGNDPLTMHESKFSWMNCREAKIRVIAASDREIAFEVDPKAKCGWAGWLVGLTALSPEWRDVDVKAYRNLSDYRAKEYKAFCAYSKRMAN
jgi:hypothetical protein